MSGPRILLVEDELHIAQGIVFNLEQEGYQVSHFEQGEAALAAFERSPFDLVILDRMLPGISGLEVCRGIRQRDSRVPILMLTAMGKERDRVRGLSEGADDYLTKPFSLAEFLLRIQGMLRRSGWYRPQLRSNDRYSFGDNQVDLERQRAWTPRGELSLTDLEVRMLRSFFQREGEVLNRADLLEAVWGVSPETETRTLDNFIVRLRKYFENDPANPTHFLTVRGRGYRFVRHGSSDK